MNFNLRGLAATRPAVWLVLLVIASVSLLLWPTTALLAGVWSPISDNVLSHAWLVVAVVLWGVLREAAGLPRLTGRRLDVLSIVTIVALSLLWGFAKHAALLIPQQLLWFALLLTGLWTVLGAAAARALLRPLWILGWLMPVWALPHGFLWFTSTRAVRAILELIGLPAYFEGNVIYLASGSIQIASGCAGVAFFAAALSTAAIIGYLNRASLAQHAVLLGVAAAVAMVSNWLRIVIIVVEAHRTQMQTTLITKDHYVFGWILFAIALMAYCFAFASYGLRRGKPVPTVAPDAPPPQKFDLTRLAIGLAGLAVGPLAVGMTAHHGALAAPMKLASDLPGFHPVPVRDSRWYPSFPNPDASTLLQSDVGADPIYVYGNLFRYQDNGHRLIGDGHSVVSEHWQASSTRVFDEFVEVIAQDPSGQPWLIRYSYAVGTRFTARALEAQLLFGAQQFVSAPTIGLLALVTPCIPDCAIAGTAALDPNWRGAARWYVSAVAPHTPN